MRDNAKASSARSIFGRGVLLGLFGRAFATRGASCESQGSGAPSRGRPRPLLASLAVALLGVVGLLALWGAASAPAASSAGSGWSGLSPALSPLPVTFAEFGEGAGQINNPRGMAVDQSSGSVYIADENNQRIDEFDAAGAFIRAFGFGVRTGAEALETCTVATTCVAGLNAANTRNYNAGALYGPSRIAAGSGHVWVSDNLNRVTEFDSSGGVSRILGFDVVAHGPGNSTVNAVQKVTVKAAGGTFELKLINPFTESGAEAQTTALNYNAPGKVSEGAGSVEAALDALSTIGGLGGSVSVTRVEKSATEFEYMITFEGNLGGDKIPKLGNVATSLTGTHSISVSILTAGGAPEVCVPPPAGTDVCKKGVEGTANGQFKQSGGALAVDGSGNLWAGDQNRVQEFAPTGAYLATVTLTGRGNTRSLAVNSTGTRIYVISGEPAYSSSVRVYDTATSAEVGSPIDNVTGAYKTIALDSSEDLYVADRPSGGQAVLREFNPAGEQIEQFGAEQVFGTFGPEGIAVGADELYSNSGKFSPTQQYAAQRFSLPAPGPLPENEQAVEVLPTTTTLEAALNPENHETHYRFDWGTSESYGETTTPGTLAASFKDEPVKAPITGLIPSTVYHFHLVAESECEPVAKPGHICVVEGPDHSFETLPAVSIDAEWTSEVAATSASFHGELNPLGPAAEWWLEYGTTTAYGQETSLASLAAGEVDVLVSAHVQNLQAGTTYHYRFVASDVRGGVPYTAHGPDRTIATQLSGLGFQLPDARAWEMVSPADKHGGKITVQYDGMGVMQAAAGGDALTYISLGSIEAAPEGNRAIEFSQVLARRGANGWQSRDVTPPHTAVTSLRVGQGLDYRLFSPDLAGALVEPSDGTLLSNEASERTPYLRANFAEPAAYRPLVSGCPKVGEPCPSSVEEHANVPPGTEFGGEPTNPLGDVRVRGASPDLSHVVLQSSVPLVAGASSGGQGVLYEWAAGQLHVVSMRPAGEGGAAVSGELGAGEAGVRNAVSEGGSRVFWNPGSEGSPGSALYVRDTAGEETVRLDAVQGGVGNGSHTPVFQSASADGTRAFFTDTQRLTADASSSGADLYECALALSGGKLGCALTDLTANGAEGAGVQGILPGLGQGGFDVYLVANGVLAPGAARGDCAPYFAAEPPEPGQTCNLYALRESQATHTWQTRFIATLSIEDVNDWGGPSGRAAENLTAAASPNGRYLAFMSQRSLTGYDNRDIASAQHDEEVYRYDAQSEELSCASCNPSGARPAGLRKESELTPPLIDQRQLWRGRWLAANVPDPINMTLGYSAQQPRFVFDSGRVLFNAADSLVPADSNGVWDVYEYEPTGAGRLPGLLRRRRGLPRRRRLRGAALLGDRGRRSGSDRRLRRRQRRLLPHPRQALGARRRQRLRRLRRPRRRHAGDAGTGARMPWRSLPAAAERAQRRQPV